MAALLLAKLEADYPLAAQYSRENFVGEGQFHKVPRSNSLGGFR
jgi:hypothetical protein